MYAKSILEYVQARAIAGSWSRHLVFVPVLMALGVATLPFTLKAPAFSHQQPQAKSSISAGGDASTAVAEHPSTGLAQAGVMTSPKRNALPLDAQQRAVATYIKRKYGVSAEVV